MRIKRVRIRNFRCLEDVEIEFGKTTTFIGPNGAGKSTVLRALDWFFNGPRASELTDADCTFGSERKEISVEVEFCELTQADRAQLGSYVTDQSDLFIAWKYRAEDGSEKMTSNGRSFPPFDAIRAGENATQRKEAYKKLRAERTELELPSANTDAAVTEAMRTWELDHPDQLEEAQQTVTNFFGFNSQSKMAGLFDYVLVTADLRASEETQDTKASIIGRILERAVRREDADTAIAALAEEVRSKQSAIYDSHFAEQLDGISKDLTDAVGQYTSGRIIKVRTEDVQLKPPRTQFTVSVLDDVIETPIIHQGHGFQRALLISALQLLAKRGAAEQKSGTICLALEEPELFQHPVQAQAFSQVLRQLADDLSQSVQVTYATHSPYFLSAGHFEEIRRVTRQAAADTSRAPEVRVAHTSVAAVTAKLSGYVDAGQITKRIDGVCLNDLPEALFANAVILVEGTTDRAVLEGGSERDCEVPLSVSGIIVADVANKPNILLPHTILTALGIPCYVVFDGDKDCAVRMQANGRSEKEVTDIQARDKDLNRRLLRYLGESEVDWPDTKSGAKFAVVEDTLETLLMSDWPAWTQEKDRIVAEGLGDPGKNALVYRYAAKGAAAEPPSFVKEILERARALAAQ